MLETELGGGGLLVVRQRPAWVQIAMAGSKYEPQDRACSYSVLVPYGWRSAGALANKSSTWGPVLCSLHLVEIC